MEHEDPLQINLRSPQAAVLQASVQAKLGQLGYAAAEDAVMAEYVIVMLANRKGPHQVSDEMRDLIGEDYDPQFVEWLWGEGRAILSGGQPSTNQSGPSRELERSQSPVRAHQDQSMRMDRNHSDSGSRQARASRSRSPEQDRRRPAVNGHSDLFTSAMKHLGRDRIHPSRQAPHREERGIAIRGRQGLAMDDPELDQHRNMKREQGAYWQRDRYPIKAEPRELFGVPVQRSEERWDRDQHQPPAADESLREAAKASIFSRMSVPNPKAAEFVPGNDSHQDAGAQAGAGTPSLLSRLDPKLPDNPNPPVPIIAKVTPVIDPSSFPERPMEKSACKYALKCTNPLCVYSHPTPSLANTPKEAEAMLLSEQQCRFGGKCTSHDCTRSHPSPAVAVLSSKHAMHQQQQTVLAEQYSMLMAYQAQQEQAMVEAGRPPKCKFQMACTNPGCGYSHYDENGNIVSSPAFTRMANGETNADVAMHTSDPDQDSTHNKPSDGKPAALDRALDEVAPRQAAVCRYGVQCTRGDCSFSHPGGRYRDGQVEHGKIPCKFGAACFRPDCRFSHPPGRTVAASAKGHVSDRLAQFNVPSDGTGVERIIPATN